MTAKLRHKRMIFDISSMVQSGGVRGGILRVMNELATWAHVHRDDVVFAVYDGELETYRPIREEWSKTLLEGRAHIDWPQRRKRYVNGVPMRDRLPDPLRWLALWLHAPRRRAMVAFEHWRLSVKSLRARSLIEKLQSIVLSDKLRRELWDAQGRRRTLIAFDQAFHGACDLSENDVLIVVGSEWNVVKPTLYSDLKARFGNRFVFLCHDIIPLLFPELYAKRTVEVFRDYIHAVMPTADLVIFNSQKSEHDTRKYCEANGLLLRQTRIMRFGTKFTRSDTIASLQLPRGLEPNRYALFVSGFDERKGHKMLFSLWKRLLYEGVPEAHRFKLVFAGHRSSGNMLLKEIDAHPSSGNTLLILSGVDDGVLTTLYQHAAFCLFPSLYEGYGLPVVEGFGHGKAVLASTGGALPELIGDLSPCLDPLDDQAWYEMIKLWIQEPAARMPFEVAIREQFRPIAWQDAAYGFFRLVDTELP